MGNPQLRAVESDIELTSFSTDTYVRIKFYQQTKGTRYYRLRCFHKTGDYAPSDFPVTYLYLGSYTTDPSWEYVSSFRIQSVKNSSLVNTSFETLFTRYSNVVELRPTVELQSSDNSNFSGYETSSEQRVLSIRLKGDNFGPAWSCPSWTDLMYASTAGVRTLTGSDQNGVQSVSRLRFTYTAATARYGTSISSYSINVSGGFSTVYTPAQMASGAWHILLNLSQYYKLKGSVSAVFTVEDTRGMKTSFTRTITIVPYKTVYLTSNETHRQGGTGSTVLLNFAGVWHGSPLTLTCQSVTAYEEGSSAAYASLTPTVTVSGTSFSYARAWSGVTFDSKKAYTVSAVFSDTISTVTLTIPIPVGTPVMSIRNSKVGIENASPTYTLDVNGTIAQNDYPVLGYGGLIGDTESANLNNYTETGYYIYKAGDSRDVVNFPGNNTNTHLLMMVICAEGYNNYKYGVQKAWWPSTGDEYIRTFYGSSFTSWKKVTMT